MEKQTCAHPHIFSVYLSHLRHIIGGDAEFDEAVLADEPGGVRAARKAAERQRSAAGACVGCGGMRVRRDVEG